MSLNKHLLLAGFTAALLAVTTPVSNADIILKIDISNPTAVKFLSTAALAENDGDTSTFIQGITLLNFFTSTPTDFTPEFNASTLTSPTGEDLYTYLYNLSFFGNSGDLDLNITGSSENFQGFTTGSRALTGSSTVDLSAWISLLTMGQIGDIHSSDGVSDQRGPVIGQFEVVPEPSTLLLLTGAGSLLYFARRRSRAAS